MLNSGNGKNKKVSLEELRRNHEEFLEKMRQRGYDIEKLPPLSEQDRDELETAVHNASRTGKFVLPETWTDVSESSEVNKDKKDIDKT